MLKINKGTEPAFFSNFKKTHNPQNWDEISPVRSELRSYIIDNEQTANGVGLCTYCERKITMENSQIDHIRPKDPSGKYAHLFADYNNLTAICKSANSCGQTKDNDYDDEFINPVEKNPASFMTYEVSTAKVIPVDDNVKQRVERTCEMLRLNSCFELLSARKKLLNKLYTSNDRGAGIISYLKEFPTLIEFYRREFLS